VEGTNWQVLQPRVEMERTILAAVMMQTAAKGRNPVVVERATPPEQERMPPA